MPYYRQEGRRELFPMGRQRTGPPPMSRQRFGPPQVARQRFGSPRPNGFSRMRDSFYSPYPFDPGQAQQQFNPYQQGQQQFYPYQQVPGPRYGGLTDNLNTMMGHVGTVTNGINMMRQVGSIISLFR